MSEVLATATWPEIERHRQLLEQADLTEKQLMVLQLRASGMGYRPIARALGISPAAVRDRYDAALRKIHGVGKDTDWLPSP